MDPFKSIYDRATIANVLLEIPISKMTYILYHSGGIDGHYTEFSIEKKSGGTRVLAAPDSDLKAIQKTLAKRLWVKQNIIWENLVVKPNLTHGFVKGKSIYTNAYIHKNKKYVLNIDLEDFFQSFHFGRVRGYFEKNKEFMLQKNVATILAQLTCYKGSLPQGAPTSPIITNLICQILDMKILKLSKSYKLDYSRYADDLTFSTNCKHFVDCYEEFYDKLKSEIEKAGFKVNTSKTRLSYRDSKQQVTGLVVNKKVNSSRDFCKTTKAMANQLYHTGEFEINGERGSINQLEGRFSFINQSDFMNNLIDQKIRGTKLNFRNLNGRERQYQKFIFYKYFIQNPKPIFIVEGKTDSTYIKAALKNLYAEYPELVTRNENGKFDFHISFLNKTKRLKYFFDLREGGDSNSKLYKFFVKQDDSGYPNLLDFFKKRNENLKSQPVIFVFDNEMITQKPLKKFIGSLNDSTISDSLKSNLFAPIHNHLFVMTNSLVGDKKECEIEDLFDSSTLQTKLGGKTFNRSSGFNSENHYGKEIFSKYIASNYQSIDFSQFREMLNAAVKIVRSAHD